MTQGGVQVWRWTGTERWLLSNSYSGEIFQHFQPCCWISASPSNQQSKTSLKNKTRSIGPARRECKMMSYSFQFCIMAIVLRRALSPGTYEIRVLGRSKNSVSLLIRYSQIMLFYPTNLNGVLQTQRQKKLERFFKVTTDHHLWNKLWNPCP